MELILSILIFSVVLMLLDGIFVVLQTELEINQDLNNDALLLLKIQTDISTCQKITNYQNFTCTQYNGDEIEYQINQKQQLIRTVNNRGNEIINPSVSSFELRTTEPIEVVIDKQRVYNIGISHE